MEEVLDLIAPSSEESEARFEATEVACDYLQAETLLEEAARLLRRENASPAERRALASQITAFLEGDLPDPFTEAAEYEPGCSLEKWP